MINILCSSVVKLRIALKTLVILTASFIAKTLYVTTLVIVVGVSIILQICLGARNAGTTKLVLRL